MKLKINMQMRLYLSGAIILLIGLGASAVIYLTATDVSETGLVYEFEESKQYMHDLELYGGKMNVLTVELTKWFNGLWHGKSLAYTLGCITILISASLFFIADHWPSDLESDDRDEGKREGNG
jgi:hypothetical protein